MWINFKNHLIFRDNILQYLTNPTPDFVIVPVFLFAMLIVIICYNNYVYNNSSDFGLHLFLPATVVSL